MTSLPALALHLTLLVAFPPLVLGVINKTKALFGGRVGPPVLQLYYDLFKLVRKGMVVSTTATWIFRAGPVVTLVAVLGAGLLVPIGRAGPPVSFAGDLVLFVYFFGLARFFTTAAALDTGSPFEGMGAAREVTFACLSEPATFFALLVLAKASGSLSMGGMLAPLAGSWTALAPPMFLVSVGLFVVLLAETCRIPVDDPNTHLELTMIHEVMVLDHSGPLFGLILYAAAIKMVVLGTVLLHVLSPFETAPLWLGGPLFVAEMLALAVVIGVVESVMARLRMTHVPYLLLGAIFSCGFGFLLLARSAG